MLDPKVISEKVLNGEAYLLDTRTQIEYEGSHAKGAMLWDVMKYMEAKAPLPDIDSKKEVYVYCRTGSRSRQAQLILEENGFQNVTNIGGLIDWESAGGEIE